MSQTKAQLVSVEGGVGNGTAALPALTGDDTDTGLSFGTNEVSVSTSGSERFRFGSAGQLGIGGATYGTSGQVLTSGGASAAPSWAAAGATWNTGTLTSLSGATVTITGIPSNAVKVLITIQDSSLSGTSNQFLRLGTSGGIVTANYGGSSAIQYSSGGTGTAGPTTSFNITGLTSTSHSFSGHILITNIDTGDYVATAQMHSTNNQGSTWFGGRVQLGGTLDRVQWGSGSTFDAGQIRVDYLTQD
ncbi:MAG: hypothetical protein VW879_15425 [Opitutae bacterium]|jgi:hypothetical protein